MSSLLRYFPLRRTSASPLLQKKKERWSFARREEVLHSLILQSLKLIDDGSGVGEAPLLEAVRVSSWPVSERDFPSLFERHFAHFFRFVDSGERASEE